MTNVIFNSGFIGFLIWVLLFAVNTAALAIAIRCVWSELLQLVVPKTHPGRLRAGSQRLSRRSVVVSGLVAGGGEGGIDVYFISKSQTGRKRIIRLRGRLTSPSRNPTFVFPHGSTDPLFPCRVSRGFQSVLQARP